MVAAMLAGAVAERGPRPRIVRGHGVSRKATRYRQYWRSCCHKVLRGPLLWL